MARRRGEGGRGEGGRGEGGRGEGGRGEGGRSEGGRARRVVFAAACAALLSPVLWAAARAHPLNELGLGVRITQITPVDGGFALSLRVINRSGVAATLRRVRSDQADRVRIWRRRRLFGAESWQLVRFLRLEPDKDVLLAPPEYRVVAEIADPSAVAGDFFVLLADFGPLGQAVDILIAPGGEEREPLGPREGIDGVFEPAFGPPPDLPTLE